MGYLGGYLEAHGESLMRIYVPVVSYDMLTLVSAYGSGVSVIFTCFGVVEAEWWFVDLLLFKLN